MKFTFSEEEREKLQKEAAWTTEVSIQGTDFIKGVLDDMKCDNPLKRASVLATANNIVMRGGQSYLDIAKQIRTFGVDRFLKKYRELFGEHSRPASEDAPRSQRGTLYAGLRQMRDQVTRALQHGKRPLQSSIKTEESSKASDTERPKP